MTVQGGGFRSQRRVTVYFVLTVKVIVYGKVVLVLWLSASLPVLKLPLPVMHPFKKKKVLTHKRCRGPEERGTRQAFSFAQ